MKKTAIFLSLTVLATLTSFVAAAQNAPDRPPVMPPGMMPPGARGMLPPTAPAATPTPPPQATVMPLMPKVDTVTLDELKDKMTATPDPLFTYQSRIRQLELQETLEKQLLDVAATQKDTAAP